MQISHCDFPEEVLYNLDNFVWIKTDEKDRSIITLGVTPILTSLAGKLTKIKIREVGTTLEKNKSVGSIESTRYFGMIRCPFKGEVIAINDTLTRRPKIANDSPYIDGWFVKIRINDSSDIDTGLINGNLQHVEDCHVEIEKIIKKLRVRCFSAFPDHEMFEIGVECAATLTKLDELVNKINTGNVVHVVSDDTSADLEMIRWSEERGQGLLEFRKEGNLFHFIIKKLK